ncbi:hypothetical protein [Gulosibacter sp. 10]|uniref:hypothetical protein n=1 Tax=Gulosibacter sp. 10 TaxID=1255570 RepID=UPI00097EE04B|nr:hypothetical protein [Gulosibacter sp. 10]SJM70235.1 hypothetical protein FM112_14895 [Gulosibacter sp. 10]
MEIALPADCGNAPRIGIVGDFAVDWARRKAAAVAERLAEDATWTVVGEASRSGASAVEASLPPFEPERIEVVSIITHGRLASCDGVLEGEERRLGFSLVLRFASTSKTARIAELRSYCIEMDASG